MSTDERISQPEEIEHHLRQFAARQVRLQVFDNTGSFLSRGWIQYEPGDEDKLAISPKPLGALDASALICRCVMDEKLFTFTTRPLGSKNGNLLIAQPSSILHKDRRKNYRVTPLAGKPVIARIEIPNTGIIQRPLLDISFQGFSVLLPCRPGLIKKGMSLPVMVTFPGGPTIESKGLVKNISAFMHVWRAGFSFSGINGHVNQEIISYCIRREFESKKRSDEAPIDWKKVKVAVIEAKDQASSHLFLKNRFEVKSTEYVHAIKLLRSFSPEVILVDLSREGARLVLKTVTRDPALKHLPLLLLGRKNSRVKGRPGAVTFVRTPYEPEYLLDKIKALITRYRQAESCRNDGWKLFLGTGKKIVVLAPKENLSRIHHNRLIENEYEVFCISDELNLIQRIASIMPQIIILDDEIPMIDCTTLCRMINLNKAIRGIPKIRLVREKMGAEMIVFEDYGLTVLHKPFSFKHLLESINRSLGRSFHDQTSNKDNTGLEETTSCPDLNI